MSAVKYEYCCWCDQPTGRAGQGEDSLYAEDGTGPYCETCYDNVSKTPATAAASQAQPAQQGEQARIERMKHDFPHLIEFYGKHALGPMLPPSCLCCGQSTKDRKIGIRHMELPGVVICEPCMQAARSAPRPVLTDEQIAAISRALEALNEAKNDCPSLAEKQREYYESVISGLRAVREGGGNV